jgi:hypothetical protein
LDSSLVRAMTDAGTAAGGGWHLDNFDDASIGEGVS